jgi:hypothetical protein
MAIDAIGGDANVVEVRGNPRNRRMAVIAVVAAENM